MGERLVVLLGMGSAVYGGRLDVACARGARGVRAHVTLHYIPLSYNSSALLWMLLTCSRECARATRGTYDNDTVR